MRVVAPFGARKLIGVAVGVGKPLVELSPKSIRALSRVVDEIPALTPEFISLARWVADYYLTPLGEVLPALLPRAASLRRKLRLVLTEAGRRALEEGPQMLVASAEQSLLQRIHKRGGLNRETLRGSDALVETLRRRGWLELQESVEDSVAREAQPEDRKSTRLNSSHT